MNKKAPLLLLTLITFVFLPSLLQWMLDTSGSWYRPFIVWLVIIIVTFIIQLKETPDDA